MTELICMPAANGQGLEIVKYQDDVLLPNIVDPISTMNLVRELNYKDDDILVCSYPKCGVNWFSSTLWKLKNPNFSARKADNLLELMTSEDQLNDMESPRLLFTHLRPNRLPISHVNNGGKIILLLRNPKDVVVSYYHHYRNAKLLANKQTFDEFFSCFMSGVIPWGSFWEYLDSWNRLIQDISAGKINARIEVFFYERLKTEHLESLERLNRFLNFNRDKAYLERIIEETTIDALRLEMSRLSPHPAVLDKDGNCVIFRKGVIGDWKNHLTVAQSEQIDWIMTEKGLKDVFSFLYE